MGCRHLLLARSDKTTTCSARLMQARGGTSILTRRKAKHGAHQQVGQRATARNELPTLLPPYQLPPSPCLQPRAEAQAPHCLAGQPGPPARGSRFPMRAPCKAQSVLHIRGEVAETRRNAAFRTSDIQRRQPFGSALVG